MLAGTDRADGRPGPAAFLRRSNRRLYGGADERGDVSWATWFLPMLDGPEGLAALDAHVQREARNVAIGRRTARAGPCRTARRGPGSGSKNPTTGTVALWPADEQGMGQGYPTPAAWAMTAAHPSTPA